MRRICNGKLNIERCITDVEIVLNEFGIVSKDYILAGSWAKLVRNEYSFDDSISINMLQELLCRVEGVCSDIDLVLVTSSYRAVPTHILSQILTSLNEKPTLPKQEWIDLVVSKKPYAISPAFMILT